MKKGMKEFKKNARTLGFQARGIDHVTGWTFIEGDCVRERGLKKLTSISAAFAEESPYEIICITYWDSHTHVFWKDNVHQIHEEGDSIILERGWKGDHVGVGINLSNGATGFQAWEEGEEPKIEYILGECDPYCRL